MSAPSHLYPDAYLEHYAERYIELGLKGYGITLLQYLAAPAACETVADCWAALDARPEPLVLPQMISQAERILDRAATGSPAANKVDQVERASAGLPRRGGVPVEPLAHHRTSYHAHRRSHAPWRLS